jgi:acetyltransferase
MTTVNLHRLFNPKTVAVIGASEKEGTVGFLIMKNLLEKEFNPSSTKKNQIYSKINCISIFSSKFPHYILTG